MNSSEFNYQCYKCNRQVTVNENQKISFRDSCLGCREDLHICKNCRFYDQTLNNECAENQAEKVTEKNRSNRCEFFRFKESANSINSDKQNSLKKLEDLFK